MLVSSAPDAPLMTLHWSGMREKLLRKKCGFAACLGFVRFDSVRIVWEELGSAEERTPCPGTPSGQLSAHSSRTRFPSPVS